MSATILVVEDDPVSRDLLASLLESRGYAVDTATDSFGALRLIQDQSYDLVFIDYHLPEMDGYALARMMRTLGEKSSMNLNMVAITADKFGLAARRGADVMFDRILTKPIDPDKLFAFTDDFLAARATADGTATQAAESLDESPAALLWRARGLSAPPKAAIIPEPSATERASLACCFHIVDPAEADCLVLLRRDGLPAIEAMREGSTAFLKPVLCLDKANRGFADVLFKAGAVESWTEVVAVLGGFVQRTAELARATRQAADLDTRLAAYLHVSGQPLLIQRDAAGAIRLSGAGGFRPKAVVEALKRLGASGHVVAKPGHADELVVTLTAAGVAHVTGTGARIAVAGR